MSEKITISGESRQETGKANSRSLRSSEIVPGGYIRRREIFKY